LETVIYIEGEAAPEGEATPPLEEHGTNPPDHGYIEISQAEEPSDENGYIEILDAEPATQPTLLLESP
jgi:hypothetical protein